MHECSTHAVIEAPHDVLVDEWDKRDVESHLQYVLFM